MPIEIIRNTPDNRYGNFFLATEAPGDETTKSNVKVVSVPQNNRSKDFTAGHDTTDDDLVDSNEPDTPDNEPVPDDQDFTDGTDSVESPTDGDSSGGSEVPPPETSSDDGIEPPTDDVAVDDTAGADDTTDFTAGTEGDANADPNGGGETPPPQGTTPAPTTPQSGGTGTDQDATRKYKLYLEYMSLYNSINNYISKLEKIIRDEPADNRIVNYCTTRFRDLKTAIFDYVTIKYTQNNYIQDLLFYEKLVAMTQLILKVLANLGKNDESKK